MQKIKDFVLNNKIWSIIILAVFGLILYFIIKSFIPSVTTTTYTLGTVEQGTIVSTVNGTGQISSTNQIAVKPKSSGVVTRLYVLPGQKVYRGQTLAVLDNQTARLNLDKAKNDLASAQLDYVNTKATQDLAFKNQTISFNSNVTALPNAENNDTVIPTLSGSYNSLEQGQYILQAYACSSSSSICLTVSGIETDTVPIAINIPTALGMRGLYINFSNTPNRKDIWTINVPSTATNSYLSGSQSLEETAQKNAIALTSKQQSIANAETSLASAQLDYDNTIVSSPIDGQVGQVSVNEGQTIGTGDTVATLVTSQLFADIPFNEIDVAKIHQGDKATATFDAIPDLMLTGRVISIDLIGTVSSGVVNYNVKVGFDTEDARIKSGMSVSVTLATEVHQDVLVVPSSAVKTKGGSSYVLSATSPTDPAPTQIPVTLGISDDMNTEIISGLTQGQSIVIKTATTTAAKTATTTAPTIFSAAGARTPTGGGNATRALGR